MPTPHFFPRSTRARFLVLLLSALALAGAPARTLADYLLSSEEALIADYLVHDAGQRRPAMQLDPILARIARERAADMAARNYFDHVNPDGFAANALVRDAGYVLPAWWPAAPADNFIESISAGQDLPADAWAGWMASTPHRNHLLALDPFYQNQTSYGVGYAYSAGSTYRHYWVVLTAPPSATAGNAALFVAQTVPAAMTTGQTYSVDVSMLNTGANTWTQAAGYRLAAATPSVNWGLPELAVPADVTPGSAVTFSFLITAPVTPGVGDFQWQMEQAGTGFFGETSPFLAIPLSIPAPPPPPPPSSSGSYSSGSNSSYSAPSSSSKKKKKKKKSKSKKKKKSKSKSKK